MQYLEEDITRRLAKVAFLRAHGMSWDAVACELSRKVGRVKAWTRAHPHIWRELLSAATRLVHAETVAEAITVLRRPLRSDDEKLKSIVGRALLALREKHKPDEPVVVEHIQEVSRVAHFLQSHTDEQIDRMLAAAETPNNSQ